jgi:hypothetical protein
MARSNLYDNEVKALATAVATIGDRNLRNSVSVRLREIVNERRNRPFTNSEWRKLVNHRI